jgi:hypothetical protein
MLQQDFPSLSVFDVVSDDSQILEHLKAFTQHDIGLFIVEPEIPKEGNQDQWQDVAYMQILIVKKIPDRITLKQEMQVKNMLYNLVYQLDLKMQRHKEGTDGLTYWFSTENDTLPDEDVAAYLMQNLEVKSIQKTPVSMNKTYVGWSINFKIKL